MYLKLEHPDASVPPFALARAKAAAENALAARGLTLPELATVLDGGGCSPALDAAAVAAGEILAKAGFDGESVVLVIRKDADAASAASC